MSKELQKAPRLNEIVSSVVKAKDLELFQKAFVTASAIQELQALLTAEYMAPIMALQGTKLGFRTDKDREGGYPENVVKRCLIEAVLQGFEVVGNQFNIIAGNCYGTKEGYGYLLSKLEGLWYQITPNLPRIKDQSGAVVMVIEYKYQGVSGEKDLNVPVKVNASMGTDAVIGKATRKARHWLYTTLTGTEMPEGDVTDIDFKVVQPTKPEINHETERAIKLIEKQDSVEKLEEILATFSDELKIELHPVIEQHRIFIVKANAE